MRHRLLIALAVASSLWVSDLAAGRPKTNSAPVAAPRAVPHPSGAQSGAMRSGGAHPNVQHPNAIGSHPGANHPGGGGSHTPAGGPHQHVLGPHRTNAVLKAEVLAHSSKVQQHLQHARYWHHWHHHWVWGANFYVPVHNAGLVVGVPSGNTLSVTNAAGVAQPVRLFGVAAPLPGQAFFSESKENLSEQALQRYVRVFQVGVDPNGVMVGQVFLQDTGTDLSEKQIRDGMAWNLVDDGFSPNLVNAEESAQTARAGLWSDDYPIAPWIFAEGG